MNRAPQPRDVIPAPPRPQATPRPTPRLVQPQPPALLPQPPQPVHISQPVRPLIPPTAPPRPPAAPSQKPKKRRWKVVLLSLLGLSVALLLAVGSLFMWYQHQLTGRAGPEEYHSITITSGTSTKQIATDLESKKLIRSALAFQIYARLHQSQTLIAGSYRLSSTQSVPDIITILEGGKVSQTNILIPPGLRLDQIVAILEENGYETADIETALLEVRSHPLLAGLPAGAPIEGYLFPDTYQIGPDTSVLDLLTLQLNTFEDKLTPELRAGIAEQGLGLNEAVTLASIVQKEVADPEVQKQVAQVFLKRYREGRMLGSDVTYMYAAALSGEPATPSLNSPYNTRMYAGLPPSAISNFNISALQAVASPAPGSYNFFVAGDNGTTYFSNTLEEHEALAAKYCHKLCEL